MMAPDRSSDSGGGRFPSAETLDALRSSLARYLAGRGEEEEVCGVLARLADEAEARQLRAEHMLVAFKSVWHTMPEVRAIPDPSKRKSLLEHLVKLCIDAFYGNGRS